jgi:DUF971 family protein
VSFWDHIKPSKPPPVATEVELSDDRRVLKIHWSDGVRTEYAAQRLRQMCPCAGCVDEWTNQRTLDPASVPSDLQLQSVKAVGNYALGPVFSDGHSTGIYSWTALRELAAAPNA